MEMACLTPPVFTPERWGGRESCSYSGARGSAADNRRPSQVGRQGHRLFPTFGLRACGLRSQGEGHTSEARVLQEG